MEQPITSYCDFVDRLDDGEIKVLNKNYHDNQYGFPIDNDDELFGRLILEINQAGLSWSTILKKQNSFREAYSAFCISDIANYGDEDIARLMANSGIIRNKLKIAAIIHNAKVVLELQKSHGSMINWLNEHHPLTKDEWVKLFKKHFKFVGGEIVKEFLVSTGYLAGAHCEECAIYDKVLATKPKWAENMR